MLETFGPSLVYIFTYTHTHTHTHIYIYTHTYSQIPSMPHACDRTAAELSNIVDCQSVPILTYVNTGYVFYNLFLRLGYAVNQKLIPFWHLFICSVRVIKIF